MKTVHLFITCAALVLASCASSIEGVFEPACIAYAGDSITMLDGRFEWRRFTDQVNVDEDGNKIDPFPGFPVTGTYEVDNEQVSLFPDSGASASERFLLNHRDDLYLLTYEQNEAVLNNEKFPVCALKLTVPE